MTASESYPDDLLYHPEHDWARIDSDQATLGVTWYAQDALGELVHFEPPDVGSTVTKDASYGEVESVKAVSDLFTPIGGEIVEINGGLDADPAAVNRDPYGEGWLFKVKLKDVNEKNNLLSPDEYEKIAVE